VMGLWMLISSISRELSSGEPSTWTYCASVCAVHKVAPIHTLKLEATQLTPA